MDLKESLVKKLFWLGGSRAIIIPKDWLDHMKADDRLKLVFNPETSTVEVSKI